MRKKEETGRCRTSVIVLRMPAHIVNMIEKEAKRYGFNKTQYVIRIFEKMTGGEAARDGGARGRAAGA